MNPCSGTAPQKRPDPGLSFGPKAARCRGFEGRCAQRDDGMTNPGWTYRWNRIAAAGLMGLAIVASAGTGVRAADDDEDEAIDTKIFRGFLSGLGLRRDGGGIDYRERSPLVVPPDRELCSSPAANRHRSPRRPRLGRSTPTSSATRKSRPRARSPARTSSPRNRGPSCRASLARAMHRLPPTNGRPASRSRIRPRPARGRSSAARASSPLAG